MAKIEDVKVLTQNIIQRQNKTLKKEPISVEDKNVATDIVKHAVLNTTEDIFRYCSALNLLNSYVKEHKQEGYWFKPFAANAIYNAIEKNIPGVTFWIEGQFKGKKNPDKTYANCSYIKVGGMVFSFHYVGYKKDMFAKIIEEKKKGNGAYHEEKWPGVRLQPVAYSVFSFANELDNITEERFEYDSLKQDLENE